MVSLVGTGKKQLLFPVTRSLFYVIFLFTCFSLASGNVFYEEQILLEFKNSVSDPSGLLSSWGAENSSHCSWFGVTCDSNSRVLELKIRGNSSHAPCSKHSGFALHGFGIRRNCSFGNGKLVGKLSPVIGMLTELRVLSLPFNELSGEIPFDTWNLKNLEVLDLEGNLITGDLIKFEGLKKMMVLNLGFNDLFGEIPAVLSECRSLKVLHLAGNRINGVVPGYLGGLKNLKGVYLSSNRLVGSVPNSLGDDCQNLEHLDFSGNFLKGEIPRSLGNCIHLRTLMLFSNSLSGIIPHELGRLRSLRVLDVSRNKLTGPVPATLGHCINLLVLILSNDFDLLPNASSPQGEASLQDFGAALAEHNLFEGSIPEEITMLPKLKILWAPAAKFEGNFPINWGHCNSLEMVNLAQNSFTGEISRVIGKCKNLHLLNVSSNSLSGRLDDNSQFPCMTVLDVSANHLSGSIPVLHFNACSHLPYLTSDLSHHLNPVLAYLSFFTYKTHSQSQQPFYGANLVMVHDFGQNNFTGVIPSLPTPPAIFSGQIEFAFLAGGNKLVGTLGKKFFGECNGFEGMVVDVSSNRLLGSLTPELGKACRSLKALNASNNEIGGLIPQNLGDLKSLVVLDLSCNKLHGQIPVHLGHMKNVKYLALANNNLTGAIPPTFAQLQSLEVLDLSSNSLYGEIPQALMNLRNLTVLLLDNNKLSGKIPSGLVHKESLDVCNVSFNNLSGPLLFGGQVMNHCSFNRRHCTTSCPTVPLSVSLSEDEGGSNAMQNHDDSQSEGDSNDGGDGIDSAGIAVIISASAFVVLLLGLVVLFFTTKKLTANSRARVSGSDRLEITVFDDTGAPLTFGNIVQATRNFNASNCIGSGGFGTTYKAEITPENTVAVKRLTLERFQGLPQFCAEVRTLGRLRHPNLITLIGYLASEAEMFLIYNYLPGGNLLDFIENRVRSSFNFKILQKIALDVASALAYLHGQCPRILHRDVKPSNILLDNDLNAYLSDFGLSRILGASETHATTGVTGTFGYVAPEYALTCRVSDKADVYSYGVVLLELLSDKKALDPSFSSHGNGFTIVSWARMLLLQEDRPNEVFTAGLWDAGPQDHLVDMLHMAVLCTDDSLSTRPTMEQVVQRLKSLQPPSG